MEGGWGRVQMSSGARLQFGDHLLIAGGLWLKPWSLGPLSVLVLLKSWKQRGRMDFCSVKEGVKEASLINKPGGSAGEGAAL